MFLSRFRNTSGRLREREMLWEHEPTGEGFHSFYEFSRISTSIPITWYKHGKHISYFFKKIPQRKKRKQLGYFDHQNVNFARAIITTSTARAIVILCCYRAYRRLEGHSLHSCWRKWNILPANICLTDWLINILTVLPSVTSTRHILSRDLQLACRNLSWLWPPSRQD